MSGFPKDGFEGMDSISLIIRLVRAKLVRRSFLRSQAAFGSTSIIYLLEFTFQRFPWYGFAIAETSSGLSDLAV